jgi:CRISPR/Cas system CSM-associated protein Csm3 (group 7 of RAMP superfamily)
MTGRKITERLFIEGALVLETPAHLGNGDAEALTDMPLLRDTVSGRPLLCGTSIAGALRAYLRAYEHGHQGSERQGDRVERLFGTVRGSESAQSWLIVDDALGKSPGVELRDGVRLDHETRTAQDKKKYDLELLQAGTSFDLSFELLLSEENDDESLLRSLALALRGLERGEIGLGMRKRRGLGSCRVTSWSVRRYRMTQPQELVAWLEDDRDKTREGMEIVQLLEVDVQEIDDARRTFNLDAEMRLTSSLLIRSSAGGPEAPDMVHLRSPRPGKEDPVPVLTGTSLGGAVRARALRIAKTLLPEEDEGERAQALVDGMFGPLIDGADDVPAGSRVITYETPVTGRTDRVQQRVKIDRFTGGAYPQALFAQQPLFGSDASHVNVRLALLDPQEAEIGLLLLVLKDLWTGDLALGGEQSVGRGLLAGREATLTLTEPGRTVTWTLKQQEDGALAVVGDGDPATLEGYVRALNDGRRNA